MRSPRIALLTLLALGIVAVAPATPQTPSGSTARPSAVAKPTTPSAATRPTTAPAPDTQNLDRIAAVVNDDVVLESDVEEQLYLFLMRSQAKPDSADVDTLRQQILNQLIDEKLLVAEAKRSGVTVTDPEVNKLVDQAVAEARQRLGSDEAFRDQLQKENLTEDKLRDKYRDEIRRQQLAQKLISKNVPRPRVPASEAEAYFKAHPDKFPKVPAEFRLAVIQIPVDPDSAALERARLAAVAARKRITGGERFAKVAQELSDDPGSARSGGDLGFFARGTMDPAFERAAFALKPGVVSEPVRSPFGWHLIEAIERDTARTAAGKDSLDAEGKPVEELHARHVLFKVDLTQEDADRAEAKARTIDERARKGGDFGALAKQFSHYEGPHSDGGEIGWISLGNLQPAIRAGLEKLKAGEISEPLANPAGFNIFKVLEIKPERAYTLDEVRGELPDVVAQLKQKDRYEEWMKGLRARAVIKISRD